MSKRRRGLASLLSALVLLSALPVSALADETPLTEDDLLGEQTSQTSPGSSEQQNNPYDVELESLLPLEEYNFNLDLTGWFPAELKQVPVSTILDKMTPCSSQDHPPAITDDTVILWAKDGRDDFTAVEQSGTIDLMPDQEYDSYVQLELIVGAEDQLATSNVRYIIQVNVTPFHDLFQFAAATSGETRKEITVYSTGYGTDREGREASYIWVDGTVWEAGEEVYLSMELNSPWADQDVQTTVYLGYYNSVEEITTADAEDVTDAVYGIEDIETDGGYLADYSINSDDERSFTAVCRRGSDDPVTVFPFVVCMEADEISVYPDGLYKEQGGNRNWVNATNRSSLKDEIWLYEYQLNDPSDLATETYYLSARLYNPANPSGSDNGLSYVEKAVVGDFDTEEEIRSDEHEDIKSQLFSDAYRDGGYPINLSKDITFSVLDKFGGIYRIKFSFELAEEELPDAPTPLSEDTYFRMQGALSQANSSLDQYKAYVMPFGDDSYYYNGYQTVFLLDSSNNAISDGTTIYPKFYTGPKVEAFLGLDVDGQTESARKQTSGESEITFQNGTALEYSAAAESDQHLKNYWVTFLTRQEGPTLFVNGINNEDSFDETEQLPVREVLLTEDYDYHHDIFFANIGDAAMTGLTVKLEDAQNVALDTYWTVGETKTLQAFTTTEKTQSYGELGNVAKIRLLRATDENGEPMAGEISGKLTISADGIEPVTILLKGSAGIPKIVTDKIWSGVLYVPYSSVIQTNNMYASDAIEFTLASGQLPTGMTLKPNGEIYGVPRQTGNFTFTVSATYEGQPMEPKTFTLRIDTNTNTNVWNYDQMIWDDDQYQINVAIPNEDGTVDSPTGDWETAANSWNNTSMIFESDGEIAYFENVWLDGNKLNDGTDYDAEEGSTKITIRTQTLTNKGNGTHTIAAEFRDESGNLRRTAQNYTLTSKGGNTNSGSDHNNNTSQGNSDHSSSDSNTSVSTPVSYAITAPARTERGSVSVDKDEAEHGDVVTLTVQAEPGYLLKSIIVTDKNGLGVMLTDCGNGKYTFVMPTSKVSIHAVFEPISNPIDEFIDISADLYYADAVRWAVQQGITSGISTNVFGPDLTCSRGEIMMFLWRAAGSPAPKSTDSPFEDLSRDAYYYDAVLWAAENGITGGTSPTTCDPNAMCTRAQVIALLWRSSGSPTVQEESVFSDVEPEAYYANAVAWAEQNGITSGVGEGQFGSDHACSRAQMMVFLYLREQNT